MCEYCGIAFQHNTKGRRFCGHTCSTTHRNITLGKDPLRAARRFRKRFVQGSKGECWHWTGSTTRLGYGMFPVLGKSILAHRFAMLANTSNLDDPSIIVRHKCDTPSCVNPAHLELGTHQDNMRDRNERG